ncbi:MAG: recombinase family protein [Selenomonadaceae bacterium]|nr:recombinase family protein [Selenomonadaceae bacterium]MBR4383743.1 recombinase family protein [Selenomonadaceae bacterium]
MSVYGYARVSSKDQNESRQLDSLKKFGAEKIFVDKLSGKDFNRPQYLKLLRRLKPEDIFVVKSLDRLGRNYVEILDQWRVITKDKGASIVVLDMPLLDTRDRKDFLGTLIADLTLQIMSAFAQIERDFIRQRQAEGIAAAKARGVKFGRPSIKRPENYPDVRDAWRSGKISARTAGKLLGVNHQTFLKWARSDEEQA